MRFDDERYRERVSAALRALGVERLVLAIHDHSFPSRADEDTGRGSPYSAGGRDFVHFAAELGFTDLQLGPQGQTSRINKSPYDGTLLSKNALSIALGELVSAPRWKGLLDEGTLAAIVARRPTGAPPGEAYVYAYDAQGRALDEVHARFAARQGELGEIDRALVEFRQENAAWLERDLGYAALTAEYGHDDWQRWGGEDGLDRRLWNPWPGEEAFARARRDALGRTQAAAMERHALRQLIVHEQHHELRALVRGLGLKLLGDLQIGISHQDAWSYGALFLAGYRMGAPPSRTNPEGQPWGYPVLDPQQYFAPDDDGGGGGDAGRALGPALRFVAMRLDKMFAEFDGVRLDHPHGLVCPWVYRTDKPDPYHAVQTGARLFSSPDLPDHPALAAFAIVRREQLNPVPGTPRHADDWEIALDEEQVRRYGVIFELILERARIHGRQTSDVLAEVLSTWPYPLRRVMTRLGLGRFCVTQKARLDDPADVYRGENTGPADWIMVGNHDTPPIWRLVAEWHGTGQAERRARYLAERLAPDEDERPRIGAELAKDPLRLAEAMFADLFASPARNVSIFFADLLGLHEIYNRPGVIDDANWWLRVPADFRAHYQRKLDERRALNLPRVLGLALRARTPRDAGDGERTQLIRALDELG